MGQVLLELLPYIILFISLISFFSGILELVRNIQNDFRRHIGVFLSWIFASLLFCLYLYVNFIIENPII